MRFNFRILLVGVSALLIGLYFQLFGLNPPVIKNQTASSPIEGFFWPDQMQLRQFDLIGHDNQKFDVRRFSNHWSFVFFGFTNCPDICPVTLNTLRQVREMLRQDTYPDIDQTAFVFISVDGERDTPDHLRDYIESFGEGFIAASGTKPQIESLTTQLGVPWSIDKNAVGQNHDNHAMDQNHDKLTVGLNRDNHAEGQDYLVNHSGAIFLISPEATLASIYQPLHDADEIAGRFMQIQKFLRNNS